MIPNGFRIPSSSNAHYDISDQTHHLVLPPHNVIREATHVLFPVYRRERMEPCRFSDCVYTSVSLGPTKPSVGSILE
jgi:hypothetical protein